MKANANASGKAIEAAIAAVLQFAGIVFDRQVVIGRTIYERPLRVDFVLRNLAEFPAGLILESKWQDVGGSVDEKFAYLSENIVKQTIPTIVIADGGGCRLSARRWLSERCDGAHLIAVFTLAEFFSWLQRIEKVSTSLSTPVESTAGRKPA